MASISTASMASTEELKKSPIYLACSQMSGYCYDSAIFLMVMSSTLYCKSANVA